MFTYSNDIVEHYLHLEPLLSEFGQYSIRPRPNASCLIQLVIYWPASNKMTYYYAQTISVWVRSFGATVVLGATKTSAESGEPDAVSQGFISLEVRESCDRVVRMMVFEKSPSIPDQAVRGRYFPTSWHLSAGRQTHRRADE